jgi:hypothetical protein
MPASICPQDWIHDGECDKVCNTAAHHFDGGKKTALFEPFIYKMHYFAKTGSGQT